MSEKIFPKYYMTLTFFCQCIFENKSQLFFLNSKKVHWTFFSYAWQQNDPESSLSETPGPLRPIRQMRIFLNFVYLNICTARCIQSFHKQMSAYPWRQAADNCGSIRIGCLTFIGSPSQISSRFPGSQIIMSAPLLT